MLIPISHFEKKLDHLFKNVSKTVVLHSQCYSYEEHFTLYLISFELEAISLFFPHAQDRGR
jgi:hypothetical protein